MRLRRIKTNGESRKALEEAQTHINQAKARNNDVYHVAGSLRRLRERNHFAEQIYTIMAGPPGGRN